MNSYVGFICLFHIGKMGSRVVLAGESHTVKWLGLL